MGIRVFLKDNTKIIIREVENDNFIVFIAPLAICTFTRIANDTVRVVAGDKYYDIRHDGGTMVSDVDGSETEYDIASEFAEAFLSLIDYYRFI